MAAKFVNEMAAKKRKAEVPVTMVNKDMVDLLHQFDKEVQQQQQQQQAGSVAETSSNDTTIQKIFQLEQDINNIRAFLEKKKQKITLADINMKLDTILSAVLNQNGYGYVLASTSEEK